jgi:hypothetical protein
MWKNYFFQLLNVLMVSGIRQIEIHTAVTLVPDLSPSEVDIAIEKVRKYR